MKHITNEELKKDYTILVPNMAFNQFSLIKAALESEGYHVELMSTSDHEVAQLGLQYVHNDTCYPALLIIGQFIAALKSGRYDLDHTALIISQSGGGCRASNYIKLLRKALDKAGFGDVPVLSFNMSGMEEGASVQLTLTLILKLLAAAEYGDEIDALYHQVKASEVHNGDAKACVDKWIATITEWFMKGKYYYPPQVKKKFRDIANEFAKIERTDEKKVRVGVVGEIYVKFSPLGNNSLVKFLEDNDCEVNLPGLMGYIEYCIANMKLDTDIYGMKPLTGKVCDQLLNIVDSIGNAMNKAMKEAGFNANGSFHELMKKPEGILSLGVKMGEGWLLTAEMIELIENGYSNIVCAQPFGCLPNHIAGKGVIKKIREKFPLANITPIDYDPSSTKVNQENRIRLMLSIAKEQL